MVYCIIQQSSLSFSKIIGFLSNISNLKTPFSDTCVVACTNELREKIEIFTSKVTIPNIKIDFFELENMHLGQVVNQFCDSINYCLEQYNEVMYFDEEAILINSFDVSHLSKTKIGFLKKMHLVPEEHYPRLFSRDVFYCSSVDVFQEYADILLKIQSDINQNIENQTLKLTITDFYRTINESIYIFINNTIGDSSDNELTENDFIINGKVLCTEDFFGIAENKINNNDIDFNNFVISRYFNQIREIEFLNKSMNLSLAVDAVDAVDADAVDADVDVSGNAVDADADVSGNADVSVLNNDKHMNIEQMSVVNGNSNIFCLIIRRENNDIVKNTNKIITRFLLSSFPNLLGLMAFKNNGFLPMTIPSTANLISHWNRENTISYEGLKKLFIKIANESNDSIKLIPGISFFKIVENILISSPDTKFLTPEMQSYGSVIITNHDSENRIVNDLLNVNINYDFLFYYPENITVLEEMFDDDNDNNDNNNNHSDSIHENIDNELVYVPAGGANGVGGTGNSYGNDFIKSDSEYKDYINNMKSYSFVFLNKNNFSSCIIAEAMACGKPIIISDEITLLDKSLVEGKHYILESEYNKNSGKYSDSDMLNTMSRDCRQYFADNIKSSSVYKKIFNRILLFDMTDVFIDFSASNDIFIINENVEQL